jgi:hypothetical protein
MQASVDLAKLFGVVGDAIIVPDRARARFRQTEMTGRRLYTAGMQLDGEADETAGYDTDVGRRFRRRDD